MVVQSEQKFCLLLAARDFDYVEKAYNGYHTVFMKALGDNGETWDSFRVVEGEFPNLNELDIYKGFVIGGSSYAAFENEDWILDLCALLQTLFAMQKKVLGICFGAQVICRALGGQVRRSNSGWDIGVRQVNLKEEFYSSFGFSNGTIPPNLSIIECHQDEVWEMPEQAQVIAFSNKTQVEGFVFGDHIMGIQGHPEYTKDILNALIDHRLLANNSITIELANEAKLQLKEADPDAEYWQKICKSFLKSETVISCNIN